MGQGHRDWEYEVRLGISQSGKSTLVSSDLISQCVTDERALDGMMKKLSTVLLLASSWSVCPFLVLCADLLHYRLLQYDGGYYSKINPTSRPSNLILLSYFSFLRRAPKAQNLPGRRRRDRWTAHLVPNEENLALEPRLWLHSIQQVSTKQIQPVPQTHGYTTFGTITWE